MNEALYIIGYFIAFGLGLYWILSIFAKAAYPRRSYPTNDEIARDNARFISKRFGPEKSREQRMREAQGAE